MREWNCGYGIKPEFLKCATNDSGVTPLNKKALETMADILGEKAEASEWSKKAEEVKEAPTVRWVFFRLWKEMQG